MTAAPMIRTHIPHRVDLEADEVKSTIPAIASTIVQKWYTDTISSGLEFLMLGPIKNAGQTKVNEAAIREPRPDGRGIVVVGSSR